jgi:hypothetical protein
MELRVLDHKVSNCKAGASSLPPHAAILLRKPSYLGVGASENVS